MLNVDKEGIPGPEFVEDKAAEDFKVICKGDLSGPKILNCQISFCNHGGDDGDRLYDIASGWVSGVIRQRALPFLFHVGVEPGFHPAYSSSRLPETKAVWPIC